MFDYEKLWKLIKDKGLKKVDLKKHVGITPTTLAKLSKNENVSMEVLHRLCEYLECDIGDIVEHVYTPYKIDDSLGTFTPNKNEDIHNWFSYLEGYSKSLVETELSRLDGVTSILDPFSGSGTTPLVGVFNGLTSYYCETNPIMAFVSKIKTEDSFKLASDPEKMEKFNDYKVGVIQFLEDSKYNTREKLEMQGFEKYFEQENIFYIKKYKHFISKIDDVIIENVFKIALAGVAVNVSKMIRRGDLRYAKGKELNKTSKNFLIEIEKKLDRIHSDLKSIRNIKVGKSIFLTNDARNISSKNIVDVVITSPPYLNGTNYIRNTKLELKLLDYVSSEQELAAMHKKGIVAGINNVSVGARIYEPINLVKHIIKELDDVSYDSRIQKMIIAYFNDMNEVFESLSRAIKDRGKLILDIGDSQFAGVHVPTHEILIEIAKNHGFVLYENEVIRTRKSKSGLELTQRILRFNLSKKVNRLKSEYEKEAYEFLKKMKYQEKGRNWGHPWHSLCSYRGKLKPAIANELVTRFTKPGDRVLDPMSGVGTIPLEASLQGRIGIANDLSEMAYIISRAKVERPLLKDVEANISELEKFIEDNKEKYSDNSEVRRFGLNKKIIEYYHPETMKEILAARAFYMNRDLSSSDCLTMSCLMHILHGNRPYALSRNSHPLTPYAPKGEFIYKNLIKHLREKALRSYRIIEGEEVWNIGEAYNYDILELGQYLKEKSDVIITSPPFASSFKFYTQNWLRLWFSGWEPETFEKADTFFFDNKQNRDMDIYYSYFKACNEMLKENGKLILHVGKSKKFDMSKELLQRCGEWFDTVAVGEELIEGENHGVVDIGSTIAHQFIFLIKK